MMKKLTKLGLVAAIAGTMAAAPAFAHHTFVMFNSDVQQLAEGVILQNLFNNPHIELTIGIQNEEGQWEAFWFEGAASTAVLGRGLMDGETLQAGDRVQFTYCPLRDGRNGGAIGWMRHTSGLNDREVDTETFYDPSDGGCPGNAAAQENWVRWIEQGFTVNTEGEAWDAENAPAEEEEAPGA